MLENIACSLFLHEPSNSVNKSFIALLINHDKLMRAFNAGKARAIYCCTDLLLSSQLENITIDVN